MDAKRTGASTDQGGRQGADGNADVGAGAATAGASAVVSRMAAPIRAGTNADEGGANTGGVARHENCVGVTASQAGRVTMNIMCCFLLCDSLL